MCGQRSRSLAVAAGLFTALMSAQHQRPEMKAVCPQPQAPAMRLHCLVRLPLGPDTAHRYRVLAARANFISMHRPGIGVVAKECCRKMTSPTSLDWAARRVSRGYGPHGPSGVGARRV